MRKLSGRIARSLGIDRAIGFSLLATFATNAFRPISLAVTFYFLTIDEQGFYGTFQSLLAIQVFLEMGFGLVLQQSVAVEFAHLSWRDGKLEGDPVAKARLAALFQIGLHWYRTGALIVLFLLMPAGWFFLAPEGRKLAVSWELPWILSVCNTALAMAFVNYTMVVNGCGRVDATAKITLWVSLIQPVLYWIFLVLKLKLAAAPLAALAATAGTSYWLLRSFRPLMSDLRATPRDRNFSWRRELWPFQWRIGLSWMAGYFIFQTIVPFTFKSFGPATAGRIFNTMTLMAIATNVGQMWVNTAMPRFGALASRGAFAELDAAFRLVLLRSTGIVLGALAALLGGILLLNAVHSEYALRFLPLETVAALVAAGIAGHINNCLAGYLRAFKREPFLPVSLAMGAAVLLLIAATAGRDTPDALLYGYAAASAASLVAGVRIFAVKRRQFQALHVPLPGVGPSHAL